MPFKAGAGRALPAAPPAPDVCALCGDATDIDKDDLGACVQLPRPRTSHARRAAVEITCQRDSCDTERRYHVACAQDFFERTASTPGTGRWIGPHDLQHLRLAGACANALPEVTRQR
jgi:hypothetical protein